jgi:hypothetical protein
MIFLWKVRVLNKNELLDFLRYRPLPSGNQSQNRRIETEQLYVAEAEVTNHFW